MIVPMKKVSLIILGDKKADALKRLRHLGLVHIEIKEGSGEKLAQLKEQIATLENGAYLVSERAKKLKSHKDATPEKVLSVAQKTADLSQELKTTEQQKTALETEIARLKSWGEVDPEEFEFLKQKGIELWLYEMPTSEFKKLSGVKAIVVNKTKALTTFLLAACKDKQENETVEALKNYNVSLPNKSTAEIKNEILALEQKQNEIQNELDLCAEYAKSMKDAITAVNKQIEFEVYATGMQNLELSERVQNGVSIAYFKGYIEAENIDKLKLEAQKSAWGLVIEDPTEEDDVPTKLKNNRFVSLIYPLTDFLGTVPGYFEHDISAWFLGFILIFFGIIFGDGVYGLLITAVAAIPIIKALASKKEVPPTFLLVGLFGLSTMLWGLLTCTWFGLSPNLLPNWLKALSIPVISNVYADKIWQLPWTSDGIGLTTSQNLQIFCFTLALIQLSVAHIKGAARNKKSIKVLGDIGSVLQLVGIYYVVLSLVVNSQVFPLSLVVGAVPVGTLAIVLVGIGFAMNFVFSNYEGSILKSVLSSLTDIVSMLLGVVNVFSDIVSYIRLWAVGLAGAAISATVNELASPMLGNFLFMIIAIVLLVFGHGLNMILNVLSVIVHGIRLNTLEFSSHLDMSWSGHKFKPFEE